VAEEHDHDIHLASDSFAPRTRPARVRWDDDEVDPEETTYLIAERGPAPVPGWVITAGAARQLEYGKLKGGKEAEVFLIERTHRAARNLLAAKRYRDYDGRDFRDDARYRARRRTGESRIDRAIAKGTRRGMRFRGQLWAANEWEVLGRLWSAGVAVPYPVQKLGTEIMLEFVGDDGSAAPRLAETPLDGASLRDLHTQVVAALFAMVRQGVVHADLSPYNVLVWDGRAVLIDFPQAVHPQDGPDALALLQRDITNLVGWFKRKGVETNLDELYSQLVAEAFA
jgi:RIO kinase 1